MSVNQAMYHTTNTEIADQRHDSFIQKIIQLRQYNISQEIQQRLIAFSKYDTFR